MPVLESTDSPQLKLVHSLIDVFQTRDVDHLATLLHKDHRRIYHPRSLGKPEETREEWLKNVAEFISLWTSCRVGDTGFYYSNFLLTDRFTASGYR